jgi:hypothetical protein
VPVQPRKEKTRQGEKLASLRLVVLLLTRQVPRHIQKQREEAAAHGGQVDAQNEHGLSIQTGRHFERMPEMDDELWSPDEATPISQHFPTTKGEIHHVSSPGWNALPASMFNREPWNPSNAHQGLGAGFNPPVTHMMIDPLLLGAGEGFAQPQIHPHMPRGEELMYAMHDMHLLQDRTPVQHDFANVGYPMYVPPPSKLRLLPQWVEQTNRATCPSAC